jgi:predicted nicotinamide N-methyase
VNSPDSLDAIEASLRRRFRVVNTPVAIGARTFDILHPVSAEDLINEVDFERDERLPYWAELWPSSRILGEVLLGLSPKRRSVLELGCGSGLVSVCAAAAGFSVVVSDYYEDACRFARVNVHRNSGVAPGGLLLDWRHLPEAPERFDMVLAADVLYERPYGVLVARAVAATLAAGGTALVADPGRVGRSDFLAALAAHGLRLAGETTHSFIDGIIRQTISVLEVVKIV